jgi:hypothetical protein
MRVVYESPNLSMWLRRARARLSLRASLSQEQHRLIRTVHMLLMMKFLALLCTQHYCVLMARLALNVAGPNVQHDSQKHQHLRQSGGFAPAILGICDRMCSIVADRVNA